MRGRITGLWNYDQETWIAESSATSLGRTEYQHRSRALRYRGLQVKRTVLFLTVWLAGCEIGYSGMVRRSQAIGGACTDRHRKIVFIHKSQCCEELGRYEETVDLTKLQSQRGYLEILTGVVGDMPVWAQLQIICPSTGAMLYDSGRVSEAKAFCFEGNSYYYIFEGHAQRSRGESCFPPDAAPSKVPPR